MAQVWVRTHSITYMLHAHCGRCVWLLSLRQLHFLLLSRHLLSYHPVLPSARQLHLPGCGGQIPCALPPMRTLAPLPSTILSQLVHRTHWAAQHRGMTWFWNCAAWTSRLLCKQSKRCSGVAQTTARHPPRAGMRCSNSNSARRVGGMAFASVVRCCARRKMRVKPLLDAVPAAGRSERACREHNQWNVLPECASSRSGWRMLAASSWHWRVTSRCRSMLERARGLTSCTSAVLVVQRCA